MTERRLGRGLDFLIKRTTAATASTEESSADQELAGASEVSVEAITPNRHQPRRIFDLESLNDLVESIRTHGIIQPVAVRRVEGGFELISGERRWRAVSELGWQKIPATIHDVGDQQMLELALVENIQRENLDPIEKARAYRKLIVEFELTQGEAAKRLSQKRSTVANFVRLLDLPKQIREMTSARLLSMGQSRALLAFEDPVRQLHAAQEAAKGKLTVRDLERMAKASRDGEMTRQGARKGEGADPNLAAVAGRLREALGTKVALTSKGGKGRIVIDYFDTDALNRILACIESGAHKHQETYRSATSE